jgi:hypothetical protein
MVTSRQRSAAAARSAHNPKPPAAPTSAGGSGADVHTAEQDDRHLLPMSRVLAGLVAATADTLVAVRGPLTITLFAVTLSSARLAPVHGERLNGEPLFTP